MCVCVFGSQDLFANITQHLPSQWPIGMQGI